MPFLHHPAFAILQEVMTEGAAVAGVNASMLGDVQSMLMAGISCAQHGISIIEVQPSCLAEGVAGALSRGFAAPPPTPPLQEPEVGQGSWGVAPGTEGRRPAAWRPGWLVAGKQRAHTAQGAPSL